MVSAKTGARSRLLLKCCWIEQSRTMINGQQLNQFCFESINKAVIPEDDFTNDGVVRELCGPI